MASAADDPGLLLEQLFVLPATEWSRCLDDLCAAHPALAAELRRRFAILRSSGLAEEAASPGSSEPYEIPERLGEFRLLRRLGTGGMGMVFAAEQTSLHREVALKVVRPELLFAEGARERFQREIDAVAKLAHPAILPVLAHGETMGVPYYVMPLLPGCSGDELLRRLEGRDPAQLDGKALQRALGAGDSTATDGSGPFASGYWQACVALCRQVALGLHHAHCRGIVHRDIKPSNVMLLPDGRAMVLDFGLADLGTDRKITRTGAVQGSPAYMSPEQTRGEASDQRTDVYSLAVTLFHLLALRPPFPTEAGELLRERILAGRPEPLQNRAVPPELRVVIAAAMDVNRERRHASAEAFASDLLAVLERRPISARSLPTRLRLWRWCERHRATTTLLAAVVVGALLLPALLWNQQRAANRTLAAQSARAQRSFETSLAAINQMLVRVGSKQLRNVPVVQRAAAELVEDAVTFYDRLGADLPDQTELLMPRVGALLQLGDLRLHLGELPSAVAHAERAHALLTGTETFGSEWLLQRSVAATKIAWFADAAGDVAKAAAAVAIADKDLAAALAAGADPDRGAVLAVRAGLADAHGRLANRRNDMAAARDAFTAALALERRLHATLTNGSRCSLAVAAYNLALCLQQSNEHAEAMTLLREASDVLANEDPDIGGWPTPRMVGALVDSLIGRIHQADNELGSASEAYERAIETGIRLVANYPHLPSLRRDLGATRNNLAIVRCDRSDWGGARVLLEDAERDLEAAIAQGPDDADAARFLLNVRKSLCATLRELGDPVAYAAAARAYGAMPGGPEIPRGAARHLLRCATAGETAAATALLDQAMQFLLESERRGWGKASLDDGLYAPLAERPEFLALRSRLR